MARGLLVGADEMRPSNALLLLAPLAAACSIRFGDHGASESAPPPPAPPPPPVYADPPDAPGPRSSDYEVGQLAAEISAQVDEDVLHVYGALVTQNVAGIDVHVRLVTGDYFTAKVGDTELALVEEPDPGPSPVGATYRYFATFPAPTDTAEVVVAFRRPATRDGAPLSTVRLPPDFHIVAPPTQVRAGDTVTLTAAPPDANDPRATVTLTASCVAGGTATLDPKATVPDLGLASTTGCDGKLALQRHSYGQVDSAFRRGVLDAVWTMDGSRQHAAPIHVAP
jgi:hypothetical protein